MNARPALHEAPPHKAAPHEAAPPQHSVGVRQPLLDGLEKVSGRARYTADLPFANALVGRIARSPVAHGLIRRIDASAALALPGVRAVVTGEDFSAPYGVIPIAQNEWPLARGRVRYRGEPLFAVAADDEAAAAAALAAVRFEIEPLPAHFDTDAARAPGAVLLHEDKPGNLERSVEQDFGDVEAGFAAADLVLERRFDCAEVAHGQIELNATVAQWDAESGRLTVHSVTQVPYYLHLTLARTLGLDTAAVRVIKPFVGGGFGHRVEPLNFEMVTAALARAAGGTVKLELTREEAFLTHRGRPASAIRLKLGFKRTGEITAVDAEVVQRGGAYAGYGLVTILYAGALLHALYRVGAVRYRGWRVYVNLPPCGAMRGHGAVNVRFAFESLLDEAAERLALDPFALRRANLITPPHRTLNELQVNSYGLPQCMQAVERASGWKAWRERRAEQAQRAKGDLHEPRAAAAAAIDSGPLRRGFGMACSHYVSGSAKPVHWSGEPHAVVNLKLDFDGSITLLTGAADIGQGSSTLLAQVAAEVLLLPLARIRVVAGDSALTPKDNGSYSSRVSFMVGNAAMRAAEALKGLLVEAAARRLGCAAEDIEWLGERCVVTGSADSSGNSGSERALDFAQVVQAALADGGTLTARGSWSTPPETQGGRFRGAAVGSAAAFSYAAQVVEVEVDEGTGEVRVLHCWAAHDCGRAINPLAVEGQVQGAVWMGLGQALSEETQYHEGLPLRANFLDYRMPTAVDSPPIDVTLVESIDPLGPFGAKEASEGGLHSVPPALAAAIHDATGLRITTLPITPDRLLEALQQRRREARLAAARRGRSGGAGDAAAAAGAAVDAGAGHDATTTKAATAATTVAATPTREPI
ncbi:MAG: 4-hydroxybenzoyl-CoA reductase subunit alpha [Burkholderiales bacterium]|nr:4-hydroxybenzoyl-CoA reductase subunit alpha [Burkholderiales bacterium]